MKLNQPQKVIIMKINMRIIIEEKEMMMVNLMIWNRPTVNVVEDVMIKTNLEGFPMVRNLIIENVRLEMMSKNLNLKLFRLKKRKKVLLLMIMKSNKNKNLKAF